MKLINPVGRDMSTFDVQANNCGCICSNGSSLHSSAYSAGDANCGCECSFGNANRRANFISGFEQV